MTDLKEESINWYFTFGGGHKYPMGYVVINGTFGSARDEMFRRYGNKWAFQYSSREAAGVDEFNLQEVEE